MSWHHHIIALTLPACLILGSCDSNDSSPPIVPEPITSEHAVPQSDWKISRGNPQLQGRVHSPVPRNPRIEWSYDLGHPAIAEAAVSGNHVVVGDVMGNIHCLDLNTRQRLWLYETEDSIEAAPAISNGRVFVGSGDEQFLAIDLQTGNKIWSIQGSEKFPSAANIVPAPDGRGQWVLVNGYDGITRCLRADDGSTVWSYQSDDYINGTPAIINNRLVAFGGCDRVIHVLNLADGSLVNELVTDAQITASVATSGNTIYCGNYANQVIAAEADGEQLSWIYQTDDFPFFSSPTIDDMHVYIGSRDKRLHAIHRKTGKAAWTFKTGSRIESSALAFDDAVVFGSNDGRLYALHPSDGTELWRLDLGEDLGASPAYASGRIIIAGGDGTLFIIK